VSILYDAICRWLAEVAGGSHYSDYFVDICIGQRFRHHLLSNTVGLFLSSSSPTYLHRLEPRIQLPHVFTWQQSTEQLLRLAV
jgi:hypothetical protein